MINIKDFTKEYSNGNLAVDDISFTVNNGEIFGFLGPNGAGKSTTIKTIVGINKPTKGTITINGLNIKDDPIAYKKQFSYVPDNPFLFDKYSGYEYLNFIADIYEVDEETRKERIEYYLKLFPIEGMDTQISSYSHGMQQKLAIIGALLHDPDILILDEPMVGLDAKSSYNLKKIMRKRVKEGKSVIFSTHVMEIVENICDRVAIISKGKIVAYGTISELKQDGKTFEEVFLELTDE